MAFGVCTKIGIIRHFFVANTYGCIHLTLYFGLFQTGYSVVAACVVALRLKDKASSQVSSSTWREGVICLLIVACGGFSAGLCYRFSVSIVFLVVAVVVAILAMGALCFRQVSDHYVLLFNWLQDS